MRTNMLLCGLGTVAVGVGAWLDPWALLVAAGASLVSVGLLRDDGKPKT